MVGKVIDAVVGGVDFITLLFQGVKYAGDGIMNMKVDPVIGAAGCFQVYTHFLFISGYTVNVPDSYSIT
jgi:hypothetical protein